LLRSIDFLTATEDYLPGAVGGAAIGCGQKFVGN
jgi:hypothetical protein